MSDSTELESIVADLRRWAGELDEIKRRLQLHKLRQADEALNYVVRDVSIAIAYVEAVIPPPDETPLPFKRKTLNMRFLNNA